MERRNGGRPLAPKLALTVCIALTMTSTAHAQSVLNAHVSSAGVQGNLSVDNDIPVLSDAGRWVAFASPASNLVAGDGGDEDIFVHDNLTGVTVLLTPAIAGARRPAISGNGRYVAFQAPGANVVDVYRYDRDSDGNGVFDEAGGTATVLVSVAFGGGAANGPSRVYSFAISDDGDRVVFDSDATNLTGQVDMNMSRDCFLRVMSTGMTSRVSGGANMDCVTPAISGDGNTVAFVTNAANLLAPGIDTNGTEDVYVYEVSSTRFSRASVSSVGAQATGFSNFPSLDDAGANVVFTSGAPDLVAGDTNGVDDIFVRDRLSGRTLRVNVASGGAEANGASNLAAISGNGQYVSFVSLATNLGATGPTQHVYVRARTRGLTWCASRSAGGTPGDAMSAENSLSDDGSSVAFRSFATNLLGAGGDTNGFDDMFVRLAPGAGPGSGVPITAFADAGVAVTFSVNGPVDPNTEGIRDARGVLPISPQVPLQPGNPMGSCIRAPAVPQATGVATFRTGDVNDYLVFGVPSEPELFLSAPPPPLPAGPPDGTNSQIVQAMAIGLMVGPGVLPPLWTTIPPMAPLRDNLDAVSFGEDYFPDVMGLGFLPSPGVPLPPPPLDPDGEPASVPTLWSARVMPYAEPGVMMTAPGVSLRFSVDTWSVGAPGTAVATQAMPADPGVACAGWMSPGLAGGDIFATPVLTRLAGVTAGGGPNLLVWDHPILGLTGAAATTTGVMEDELDAVECVGTNTVPWFGGGAPAMPGNVHERVMHVGGAGLPPPGMSWHDPMNDAPLFFSVTRNSVGAAGSAVRAQFVNDGGAAADIFMSAKGPGMPPGVGTNLLFIDESEIGLIATDLSPGGAGPADLTDDLDALILWVSPALRYQITNLIMTWMAAPVPPWVTNPTTGASSGPGMTISIVKVLGGMIEPGDIRVGFSVTTDAIGLEYTAVDWEAGPVAPAGGTSTAAGDVFFALPDGEPMNPNYLWFDEADLGLDPGVWVNGAFVGLGLLSDNVDALDSAPMPPDSIAWQPPTDTGGAQSHHAPPSRLVLEQNVPNPFNPTTVIGYSIPETGRVRVTVHDVAGRLVAVLVDETQTAGRHSAIWSGRRRDGTAASTGVYVLRVEAGHETQARKMILVK